MLVFREVANAAASRSVVRTNVELDTGLLSDDQFQRISMLMCWFLTLSWNSYFLRTFSEKSASLRAALRSKELQQLISEIDSSVTRREERLEKELAQNQHFSDFVQEMLQTIHCGSDVE